MTTEEAVHRLFPPKVIEDAKREAHRGDDKPEKTKKPRKPRSHGEKPS